VHPARNRQETETKSRNMDTPSVAPCLTHDLWTLCFRYDWRP
jgi:hypothetical protein